MLKIVAQNAGDKKILALWEKVCQNNPACERSSVG